jgi:hypothetical protein
MPFEASPEQFIKIEDDSRLSLEQTVAAHQEELAGHQVVAVMRRDLFDFETNSLVSGALAINLGSTTDKEFCKRVRAVDQWFVPSDNPDWYKSALGQRCYWTHILIDPKLKHAGPLNDIRRRWGKKPYEKGHLVLETN